jgi:hypothetical protein
MRSALVVAFGILHRSLAVVLGVSLFAIYVVFVADITNFQYPTYTKWVFTLFRESDGYVLDMFGTLIGAFLLSLAILRFASARIAPWYLGGFLAACLLRDAVYLYERPLINFTVWAPLAGILAGVAIALGHRKFKLPA